MFVNRLRLRLLRPRNHQSTTVDTLTQFCLLILTPFVLLSSSSSSSSLIDSYTKNLQFKKAKSVKLNIDRRRRRVCVCVCAGSGKWNDRVRISNWQLSFFARNQNKEVSPGHEHPGVDQTWTDHGLSLSLSAHNPPVIN